MYKVLGYDNPWFYHDAPMLEIPEGYLGFVYQITNTKTHKSYIGRKLFKFTKTTTTTSLNKKKIKHKHLNESDWKSYYSSSPSLNHDVNLYGTHHFRREILHLCYSKGECNYLEAKEQFTRGVLEKPKYWYNQQIRVRVSTSHIKRLNADEPITENTNNKAL